MLGLPGQRVGVSSAGRAWSEGRTPPSACWPWVVYSWATRSRGGAQLVPQQRLGPGVPDRPSRASGSMARGPAELPGEPRRTAGWRFSSTCSTRGGAGFRSCRSPTSLPIFVGDLLFLLQGPAALTSRVFSQVLVDVAGQRGPAAPAPSGVMVPGPERVRFSSVARQAAPGWFLRGGQACRRHSPRVSPFQRPRAGAAQAGSRTDWGARSGFLAVRGRRVV